MVLGQKTKLFLGKDLAFHTKTMFFQGGGKTQKHIFLDFGSIDSQRSAFFVLPCEKLVFLSKTIFSLGKAGVSAQHQLFPSENKKMRVGISAQNQLFPAKTTN